VSPPHWSDGSNVGGQLLRGVGRGNRCGALRDFLFDLREYPEFLAKRAGRAVSGQDKSAIVGRLANGGISEPDKS
jgi:hypothetical protein